MPRNSQPQVGVLTKVDQPLTQGAKPDDILEARDIIVRYGGQRAVDGVSLSFKPFTITGIIGPNGAGKSSLVDVIAGARKPTSGRVILDGTDVTREPMYQRARRGLIRACQDAQVFGRMSVLDNVAVGCRDLRGDRFWSALSGPRFWRTQVREVEEEAMDLLKEFKIDKYARTRCDLLSGGQRRIVEYLRVLAAKPRVLVLDEPSVGLAPWVVERLGSDLTSLANQGCCILLIEHEMDLIKALSHRVVGMATGRVVVDGSFEAVVNDEMLQGAYLGRI